MYFTIHCCHCISQNLCDCAWAVGDLGECAHLQDEVVSRVPCVRDVRDVRAGFGSPIVPAHSLPRIPFTLYYKSELHIYLNLDNRNENLEANLLLIYIYILLLN